MTSTVEPVGHQLLLRRDLHALAIPATKLCSWVGHGWLEQVGTLKDTGADGDAEPVYAVISRSLQSELAPRLTVIDRDVALSPLRARSVLLRTMLARKGIVLPMDPDADPEKAETLAESLAAGLLGERFADELSALALELANHAAIIVEEVDVATADDCFDTASLLAETQAWGGDPAPEITAPKAADVAAAAAPRKPDPLAVLGPESPFDVAATVPDEPTSATVYDQEEHLSEAELAQLMGSAIAEESDAIARLAAALASGDAAQGQALADAPTSPFREVGPPEPLPGFVDGTPVVDLQPLANQLEVLQQTVAEIAQRAPLDMQTIMTAIATQTANEVRRHFDLARAFANVAAGLRDFGTKIELTAVMAAETVEAADAALARPVTLPPPPPRLRRRDRSGAALLAIAMLLLGWAGLYYLKTGNLQLTLGGLVAANFAGCALLAFRRD